MKKLVLFSGMVWMALVGGRAAAQTAAEDSVDVLHYDLTLDMGNAVERQLRGVAELTFVLTKACDAVSFDLICDTLHPVSLDGMVTRGFSYDRDNARLSVYTQGGQAGDTHVLSVPYVTNGYVEGYGWGGLHFDRSIYYTLGVAFTGYPHVYGRSWFPCRDNFYDKATYRLTVTSQPGWSAQCGGLRLSETVNDDGSSTSVWAIEQPTPTYLVSVASAAWNTIEREYAGVYGTYPATLGYLNQDSARVAEAYDILEDVVPMYEHAFGPYRWGRIGYVATPKGSMEHVNNIGLVDACMATTDGACQMTICHELGHAWFGNLVTCASEGDMWINEGGASFCEEVAAEAAYGRSAARRQYLTKLSEVLRSTHLTDNGYRALSDMSTYYTYGSTTYDKGALVWHSLRGLMGDSLFYACMNRLFERCAFGNIDAASLRDSLSLYSGMDLDGFFDFHVFTPGFIDYAIDDLQVDGYNATLTLRQQLRGTDHYAYGNRVPVSFFSYDLQRSDQWMLFDDSVAARTFQLPFVAAFAVVDMNHLLSGAYTSNSLLLNTKGVHDLGLAYCKVHVVAPCDYPHAWAHVSHHFIHPTGDTVEGVVRMADRYWEVTGFVPWEGEYNGQFLYNMGSSGTIGAANLDLGFYDNYRTLDSLCLMYRSNAHEPWQVVSHKRTATSSLSNGYFVARLLPGQYTLAVADSSRLAVPSPRPAVGPAGLKIFPNPSANHEIKVELPGYDKKFDLFFYDKMGKKVLQMNNVRSGDTVRHNLPAGSYVVLIQNNFISLQSQIIVQ